MSTTNAVLAVEFWPQTKKHTDRPYPLVQFAIAYGHGTKGEEGE